MYGAPLPAFSATGSGFVNGDSMASLTGTLGFTTTATASSAVGGYPITPNGVSSANYTIAFANGTLTVVRASTATAVAASPNPDGLNQAVTFTAVISVVAPGAGAPTGIVQFFDGTTLLGSATMVSGSASLTTNGLTAGSHSISATYAGDASFEPSSGSGSLTVKTAAQSSTTAVTSSANPSNLGQNVTLTATVTAPAGLSGSVAFYDGSTLLATRTLSGNDRDFHDERAGQRRPRDHRAVSRQRDDPAEHIDGVRAVREAVGHDDAHVDDGAHGVAVAGNAGSGTSR